MAPSNCIDLSSAERDRLLQAARDALAHGLTSTTPPQPPLEEVPRALQRKSAVFVTLTTARRLRGCIGSLEPIAPLLWAVTDAAHGAGFRDPRFDALQVHELKEVEIEISILSDMEPLPASSREELLAALRPEQDGLMLREGDRRATFLPTVWEQLPDREQFLGNLLLKAGLAEQHWSGELRCFRYQTLTFSESDMSE